MVPVAISIPTSVLLPGTNWNPSIPAKHLTLEGNRPSQKSGCVVTPVSLVENVRADNEAHVANIRNNTDTTNSLRLISVSFYCLAQINTRLFYIIGKAGLKFKNKSANLKRH
jgi:hypothetical protein